MSEFTSMEELAEQLRQKAAEVASVRDRCAPWDPKFCPPNVDCYGFFDVPHPDGLEETFRFDCDKHNTPECIHYDAWIYQELDKWMERCGVPKRYRHPDPALVRAMDAIDEYGRNIGRNVRDGKGLMLTGNTGVGKTFALAYIVQWASQYRDRWRVRFVFSGDLFDALHDSGDAVDDFTYPDLLLIDDFGREYQADWTFSRFESLVEARHGAIKATCISTNLSGDDFVKKQEWARIYDRWVETLTPIAIAGKSQRKSPDAPA